MLAPQLPRAGRSAARTGSTTPARSCSPSAARCSSSACSRAACAWAWDVADQPRCVLRRSASSPLVGVRVRRARGRRARAAAVGLPPPGAHRRQPRRGRRRRDADRADLVRADRTSRACSAPAPLVAGFALAALTIGWPIAATLSGRALPADRVPRHRPDRLGVRRRRRACSPPCSRARLVGLAGRRHLLRASGSAWAWSSSPTRRRGAVRRRLGPARRRHGDQPVLPLAGQRGRRRGVRRDRQRDADRPVQPPAGRGGRTARASTRPAWC